MLFLKESEVFCSVHCFCFKTFKYIYIYIFQLHAVSFLDRMHTVSKSTKMFHRYDWGVDSGSGWQYLQIQILFSVCLGTLLFITVELLPKLFVPFTHLSLLVHWHSSCHFWKQIFSSFSVYEFGPSTKCCVPPPSPFPSPPPRPLPLFPSWTLQVGCQYNYMGLVLMTIVLDSHDAAIILKYKWFMVTISDMPLSTLIRQNTNLNKNSGCIVRYWNKGFFLAKQCIICR